MKIKFTKMEGLGNDFVVVDTRTEKLSGVNLAEFAEAVCDRHFGVGADGLILIDTSTHSDYRMRVFNPDGSEPEMCGNGIRCFARYLYEHEPRKKELFSVETKGGVMLPALVLKNDQIVAVEVDMGEPALSQSKIPTTLGEKEKVVDVPLQAGGEKFSATCVSMGNPHCIIFVENLAGVRADVLGPAIETLSAFPQRTNVEFTQVISDRELRLRVWERGAGETLACGTGACAALVAGVLTGRTQRQAVVHLPGGPLQIEWLESNNHVMMTGPARTVFEGTYTWH